MIIEFPLLVIDPGQEMGVALVVRPTPVEVRIYTWTQRTLKSDPIERALDQSRLIGEIFTRMGPMRRFPVGGRPTTILFLMNVFAARSRMSILSQGILIGSVSRILAHWAKYIVIVQEMKIRMSVVKGRSKNHVRAWADKNDMIRNKMSDHELDAIVGAAYYLEGYVITSVEHLEIDTSE